jgi:hypothetical protein
VTQVHHDVGVNVRNLSVSNAETFEPALVDQSSCTDAFDLLEDRACARVNVEPRVTGATPTQVLLHDSMHRRYVARGETKRDGQRDVAAFVKDAGVVAKSHVLPTDGVPCTVLVEQLSRLEHFLDEHGPLAVWRWGEEMEILPDRTANGARNTDVVFQSRPAMSDRLRYQIAHDHATLAPHTAVFGKSHVASGISYHEASKSSVAGEDICSEAEDEVGHTTSTRGNDSVCEIVGGYGIVEQVRRTSNAKCRV